MSNTKEFTINCSAIRVKANNVHNVELTVEDPDMNAIFQQFDEDDIVKFVERNLSPGEVFPDDTLEEWAEKHGFTKIDQD